MRKLILSAVLALVSLGVAHGQEVPTSAEAYATYLIHVVLATPADVSPVTPSDVCGNCGGDGEIGDGRTRLTCPECDGTGKPVKMSATPELPPVPIPDPVPNEGFASDDFGVTAAWPARSAGIDRPVIKSQTDSEPVVFIYIMPNCEPCDRLKREQLPNMAYPFRLIRGGPYRVKPTIELRANGRTKTLQGYHTAAQISAAMQGLLE